MANTKEPSASVGKSIARPGYAAEHDEPNRISDFEVAASYNWLDEKNPTILVPGKSSYCFMSCFDPRRFAKMSTATGIPPVWSPPAIAPALKPDYGPQYVDQNTDRNPNSPLDSLILAVQTYQPDFDFPAVDMVSDRRPLRKLYGFVTGETDAFEFGAEMVGNTALFVRMEKQTREELPSTTFHGYRQAFEEQYTKLSASAKGSTSHHRIVRYNFGGFVLLVRSGADVYLQELVKGQTSLEKPDTEDLLSQVNVFETLSLGSRTATPTETKEKQDGRVTVVQGGQMIPHAAVLELTTRSKFAKRPFDIEQKMPDLWISQTPNFIEAYHRSVGYKTYNQPGLQQGKFDDIKVKAIREQLAKWETVNASALGKLATVLGQVIEEVKKAQGPCIVRYTGLGDNLRLSTIEALPSLSEDLKSLFHRKE